jgi:hypothetical protein
MNRHKAKVCVPDITKRSIASLILCAGLISCEPRAPVAKSSPTPSPPDFSGIQVQVQGPGQAAPSETPEETPTPAQAEPTQAEQTRAFQAERLKQLQPPAPPVIQSNPQTLMEYMNQTGAAIEGARGTPTPQQ